MHNLRERVEDIRALETEVKSKMDTFLKVKFTINDLLRDNKMLKTDLSVANEVLVAEYNKAKAIHCKRNEYEVNDFIHEYEKALIRDNSAPDPPKEYIDAPIMFNKSDIKLTPADRSLYLRLQTSGDQDDKIIDKLLQSNHQESELGRLEDIEDLDSSILNTKLDASFVDVWKPDF
jgi:hypothetical protein